MIPRHAHMTDLRRNILEALDRYVFLSTPQTYRVIPKRGTGRQETWERALRRALDLSEKAGYVTHGPIYEERRNKRSGFATRRFVYYLTRKGAEKLTEHRTNIGTAGITMPKVAHYQRKPASLSHEVAITEFRLMLEEALLAYPHLRLHWLQKDIRRTTNPDAIFGIQDTRKPRERSVAWFFLEIEKSRAGNWKDGESQKVRKAKRYAAYRRDGEFKREYSYIADFRVIFTEETSERMTNLVKKFAPILPVRFIWVTSQELLREKGILESVFYAPRDFRERSQSLLELMR